ncbi:unnamed protein product, partial [Thlaspi arvense]
MKRTRHKAPYNVICYSDPMRLKTAEELLKTTKYIESNVEKFLYEKSSSKDKTLKIYEDGYHCILEGEPDDRILTVLNDIISWLDS